MYLCVRGIDSASFYDFDILFWNCSDSVEFFFFFFFIIKITSMLFDNYMILILIKKPEYPERTTDHGQATGKLYHLRLRVECTLFVIYKTRREPTPYW